MTDWISDRDGGWTTVGHSQSRRRQKLEFILSIVLYHQQQHRVV